MLKPPMKPADKARGRFGAALVWKSCFKDLLGAIESMSKYMSKLEQNYWISRSFTQGSLPLPYKESKLFWNKGEDAGVCKDRK